MSSTAGTPLITPQSSSSNDSLEAGISSSLLLLTQSGWTLRGKPNRNPIALSLRTSSLNFGDMHVDVEDAAGARANKDGSLSFFYWPYNNSSNIVRVRRVAIFDHTQASSNSTDAALIWATVLSRWALNLPFERLLTTTTTTTFNGTLSTVLPLKPLPSRHLRVFINPNAGSGGGERAWARAVPMLEDAGIIADVIVTKSAGEARRNVADALPSSLSSLEGIVVVGGDGSLVEVIDGLMSRSDWAIYTNSLILSALPSGSGNGLAVSLCASAGLSFSPDNSSWAVAKGASDKLDLASVFCKSEEEGCESSSSLSTSLSESSSISGSSKKIINNNNDDTTKSRRRRWSFLSLEWALPADLDIESEYLRCLGGARFDVYAFCLTLQLRRYRGRFSYVLASPETERESTTRESIASLPELQHLVPFNQTPPSSRHWKATQGIFTFLWATNTSHQAVGASTCATTRHDSGTWSVALMREPSRCSLLSALLTFDMKGSFAQVAGVEILNVVAWRLDPEIIEGGGGGNAHGNIAIDGEEMPYGAIQGEVHKKLLRVYARPTSTGAKT